MSSLFALNWFLMLCVSVVAVFQLIGISSAVSLFPEGRRWWHFPAQIASLAIFAAVVLNHPFG